MLLSPTTLDLWVSSKLAGFLGQYPLFDAAVQSAIRHNVLGGVWYAAAMFVAWVLGTRPGQEPTKRRSLTILLATAMAVLFSFPAAYLISWLPPSRYPALADLYPAYIEGNVNLNSFPSQSVALYTPVAAGIYSLHRFAGILLWLGLPLLVALPRMYVGGHYLTDVMAGLLLGMAGYMVSRYLLEPRLGERLQRFMDRPGAVRVLTEMVVFAWILQIAVGFRDAVWFRNGLRILVQAVLRS